MAIKKWRGGAAAVGQVTTITFSAYTIGETYTITINGKSIAFVATVGTIASVAEGLVAAWEASTEPEFGEITASSASGLVLTANTLGVPFEVTADATGGISETITPTVVADGPNFFDNGANWDGGTVPSAGDDLVFEMSEVDLLYGLVDSTNYGDITIESTFTGAVGLPATNSGGYREYRSRFLKLGDGSSAYAITIGLGSGRQPTRVLIDAFANDVAVQVYGSGSYSGDELPVVIKNAGTTSTLDLFNGVVMLDADTSATFTAVRMTPGESAQAQLVIGQLVAAGAVLQSGGDLEHRGAATSLTVSDRGVAKTVLGATCPTVTVASGARVQWGSTAGITTKAHVQSQGTLDFGFSGAAKAVAAVDLFGGGTLLDPLAVITWTTPIALKGCKLSDVTLDVGRGRSLQTS